MRRGSGSGTSLILFLLLVATSLCLAQTPLQDSLLARHLDEGFSDTTRMQSLLALGKTKYRKDSLLYYHQNFEAVFQEKGAPTDVLLHNLQQGLAHLQFGDQEALPYLIRAADMAIDLGDTARYLIALSAQGNHHSLASEIPLALEKYTEILVLAESRSKRGVVIKMQNNIGMLFSKMKEYDKAREYFKKYLANSKELGRATEECRALNNIGNSYLSEKKYHKALEYLMPANTIAQEGQYIDYQVLTTMRIAQCQLALGNLAEARLSFRQSLSLAEQTQLPATLTADILLGLARLSQVSQPDSAIHMAQRALTIAQEGSHLPLQATASKLLFELYQDRRQYPIAIAMQSQWKLLEDSIFRADNQRAIYQAEAQFKYEKEKLADQLAHEQDLGQQQLRAQRRFFLLLSVFVLTVIGLLVTLRYRQERSKYEQLSLLHEIELLKERVVAQSVSATGVPAELSLDKSRLEEYLGRRLGETTWNILRAILADPFISNKALADQVYLSQDGLSSSLYRLYKAFDVQAQSSRNKKVALASRIAKISLEAELGERKR